MEEQIAGDHYRLLVMHGRCLAVNRQLSARVVGDGVSTISQLVEDVNKTRTDFLSAEGANSYAGVKIKLDSVAHDVLLAQVSPRSLFRKTGLPFFFVTIQIYQVAALLRW